MSIDYGYCCETCKCILDRREAGIDQINMFFKLHHYMCRSCIELIYIEDLPIIFWDFQDFLNESREKNYVDISVLCKEAKIYMKEKEDHNKKCIKDARKEVDEYEFKVKRNIHERGLESRIISLRYLLHENEKYFNE